MTAAEQARALLRDEGAPEAWQHATREAIDAHLRRDVATRQFWCDVQAELRRIAPLPGPGDLDVYRSAKRLIAEHGVAEALRLACRRGAEMDGDLVQQAVWTRIADAINALSKSQP